MGGTAFCKQITVRGGVQNCFWLFWTNLPLFCLLTSLELIVNFKKCTITGNARAFLAALKGTVQQYFASYLNQKYIVGLSSSSDTVPLNVRAALSDFNVSLTATYCTYSAAESTARTIQTPVCTVAASSVPGLRSQLLQ